MLDEALPIATDEDADLVGSSWLVAVTVTVVDEAAEGAVKTPELDTAPAVADQVTAVLVVPATVAANCWLAPEAIFTAAGVTDTDTVAADALIVRELVAVLFALSLTVSVAVYVPILVYV